MSKVTLGERFLVPGGEHILTPLDDELGIARVKGIVGQGVLLENIVIVFSGGENPFSMLFSWICAIRRNGR
jgi:hypothetical protein